MQLLRKKQLANIKWEDSQLFTSSTKDKKLITADKEAKILWSTGSSRKQEILLFKLIRKDIKS